jgi:hypothetical protein
MQNVSLDPSNAKETAKYFDRNSRHLFDRVILKQKMNTNVIATENATPIYLATEILKVSFRLSINNLKTLEINDFILLKIQVKKKESCVG